MKYCGGKNKLGKEIAKIISTHIKEDTTNYIEPFCGSLGVIRHIKEFNSDIKEFNSDIKGLQNYYAYDSCLDLIMLWNSVKNGTFKKIKVDHETYNSLKDSNTSSAERAFAGFGCSYGGRFFSGLVEFRKDNAVRNDDITFRSIMKLNLKDITFIHSDYKELDFSNGKNLIYCDPPYKDTMNSFENSSSYDFNHEEFWNIVRKWKSQGNTVIISEYSAPEDFKCIWTKKRYSSLKKEFKEEKLFI